MQSELFARPVLGMLPRLPGREPAVSRFGLVVYLLLSVLLFGHGACLLILVLRLGQNLLQFQLKFFEVLFCRLAFHVVQAEASGGVENPFGAGA